MAHPALSQAIAIVGLSELARGLGVTYQAIRKWEAAGRLPRTEWTGETGYADKIVAMSGGAVRKADLMQMPAESKEAA